MDNIMDFAMNLISRNPKIANNPQAQEMIDVIKSGDFRRGEEIANNLCKTFGTSREQAVAEAKAFFRIP